MNFFKIPIIVILLTQTVYCQSKISFSIDEAISYATNNSPEIINARLKVLDAKEQKVETRAIGLPKLSISGDYNYFFDIPTQLLPDFISPSVYGVLAQEQLINHPPPQTSDRFFEAKFGQTHNLTLGANLNSILFSGEYIVALKTSKVYEKFSNQQLEASIKSVKDKTKEAYLPALLIKENIKILDKNIKNLSKLKDEMQQMYKEGFVEQLDVDRVHLSLENLKVERENIKNQEIIVKNVLKLTIGFPINDTLEISDNINTLLSSIDESKLFDNLNFERRPDFLTLRKSLELQNLNIERYKSQYLPTLIGFGSYSQKMVGNNKDDLKWFPTSLVGLSLKINIFDGLGRKAKIQRAKLSLQMAENDLTSLKSAIELQVNNARLAYNNAIKTLNTRQANLALAERIYNTSKIKYKEGVGSSVELTQAEQSLYRAQANVLKAKYKLLVAKTKLFSTLGF